MNYLEGGYIMIINKNERQFARVTILKKWGRGYKRVHALVTVLESGNMVDYSFYDEREHYIGEISLYKWESFEGAYYVNTLVGLEGGDWYIDVDSIEYIKPADVVEVKEVEVANFEVVTVAEVVKRGKVNESFNVCTLLQDDEHKLRYKLVTPTGRIRVYWFDRRRAYCGFKEYRNETDFSYWNYCQRMNYDSLDKWIHALLKFESWCVSAWKGVR